MQGSRHAVKIHLDIMSTGVSLMAGSAQVGYTGNRTSFGQEGDAHLATYMQPFEKAMPSGQSSPIFMVALVDM